MTRLVLVPERRDSLGRRIGHNWWREYVWGLWHEAWQTWFVESERVGVEDHPNQPRFKDYLLAAAGTERWQAA